MVKSRKLKSINNEMQNAKSNKQKKLKIEESFQTELSYRSRLHMHGCVIEPPSPPSPSNKGNCCVGAWLSYCVVVCAQPRLNATWLHRGSERVVRHVKTN